MALRLLKRNMKNMKQAKFWILTLALWICAAVSMASHPTKQDSSPDSRTRHKTHSDFLPSKPNYADTTQWYISDKNSDADLFYIISTETGDYTTSSGKTCNYADTYSDSLRLPMMGEMRGVDRLLSGKLNYYSPFYRQCSLQSFINDSLTAVRLPIAINDVRRAFAYYLKHKNGGRPFILAGFSQGALILLQLLREMDDKTYKRMIAAYVIGASIPPAETSKHIIAAKGASDTGVTISYNSVHTTDATIFPRSAFAINPVNWHTDATSDTLITEPTPRMPIARQKKDTMTVHLDPASNLLLVEGYTATDYKLPLIGKEGNYHSREIWLYRNQLRKNMALRANRFIREK